MARSFSPNDAKRIIKWHQNTIEKLNNIVSSVKKYRTKAKEASYELVEYEAIKALSVIPIEEINNDGYDFPVRELANHGYKTIADIVSVSADSIVSVCGIRKNSAYSIKNVVNDIVTKLKKLVKIKLDSNDNSKETTALILALSQYRRGEQVTDKCNQLLAENKKIVECNVEDLESAISSLKWFFLSREKKQRAEEAYNMLNELYESDYRCEVEEQISVADSIERTSNGEAWRDFEKNSDLFLKTLKDINPSVLKNNDLTYECSFSTADAKQLAEQYKNINEELKNVVFSVKKYRKKVREASDALVAKETMKVLDNVSIEEINCNKQGFRVKALREYGYETIADIADKSIESIAYVDGVSENAAYSIKEIVDDIVLKARQGIKVRISSDNRTQEATALVIALSQHMRSKPVADECKKLLKKDKKTIERALDDLKPATNSLKWLFSSKEIKEKASEAYNILTSFIEGDYGLKAEKQISIAYMIESTSNKEAWQEFATDSVRFFNDLEDINPGVLGNNDSMYGLPEDLALEIQKECFFPEGLLCELRRYQEWGVKYALHQERVLLGDEMGLGKTVQAIATMVSLRNTGGTHFVVVCPASVITNWCREIEKMSLLSVIKIHGAYRNVALRSWIKNGGVAVTTYETTAHFNLPNDFKFKMMVVDEAHYIKNPDAKRSINVKKVGTHAERLMFMTGTALENKVDEMISLIRILRPEIASQVQEMAFMSTAPQFRQAIAPVYYRRKREDVLAELPELIESKEWCTLSHNEEIVYEQAILSKNYADVRRVSWNVDDLKDSSKASRLLEIVKEAEAEDRKVLVFSFFLDTIKKVTMLLGDRCTGPIKGSVTPQRRQEIIDEFDKAPAGKVLVAQIQSGGTGLNIQSASVVVICEPQFKPSIENQAISRAYRMGQTRNVLVYRLLCEDTVDERIMSLLENKQAIFDTFADESVAATESREIDENTFGNIIKEEIDRINAKYNNKK